jgi:hypothetical protein
MARTRLQTIIHNICRENHYCELCQNNPNGDEYRYILECSHLSEKRNSLFPTHLIRRPNILNFQNVMTIKRKPNPTKNILIH